jgi:hypothetical protein
MDLPPLSHQALFAAVRSADAAAVRALLADAESSGTSLAALAAAQTDAGETALYVAAEAGSEEVVRLLLPLYDLEAATVRSRLDLNAFHVAAKQGHTGELSPLPPVPGFPSLRRLRQICVPFFSSQVPCCGRQRNPELGIILPSRA